MSGLDGASAALILFGLIVAALINLRRTPAWRLAVLLVASIAFVLLIEPRPLALLPLAGFLAAGYGGIVAVRSGVRHGGMAAVIGIVALFAWLKQYSFLPAGSFLSFPYLALGLSYIFFRVLHLVIEAGREGPARRIGPIHYLAYTLNFTTLVSGPIQRYEQFGRQIDAAVPPALDPAIVGRQIERIILGFFKVNVLALLFSMVQVDALAELARSGTQPDRMAAGWRLIAAYPFFLYCNFSGYIDIVIGLARLMRLELPENFDRPFSATSFLDFWNRWHITLSTWLKTYVYNPLLITLMRRFPDPRLEQGFGIGCFFVTFFLIGVWHGRTSEYVFFGILQGGGVALNKLWQVWLAARLGKKRYRALAARPAYAAVARGLTFAWFATSLIWFWADWRQVESGLAALAAGRWMLVLLALWIVATGVLAAWEAARAALIGIVVGGAPLLAHRYVRTMACTLLAAIAFLMTAVLSQPAPGIVYRTF